MGPPATTICHSNLDILTQTYSELGIPLAMEKFEGPSSTLIFLGVVIDTSGAYFMGAWLQWQWSHEGFNISIMAKKWVPIIFSSAAWGTKLAKSMVLLSVR